MLLKLLFSVNCQNTVAYRAICSLYSPHLWAHHTVNYIIPPHTWVRPTVRNVGPHNLDFPLRWVHHLPNSIIIAFRATRILSAVGVDILVDRRKFRTKIGSSYSTYLDLLVSVPQGSILGPWLFNIYMCDLFLCDCETNIINYADDTTLYACEPNMDLVLSKLEKDTSTVFTWFQNNYLKANSGKLHLLTTSNNIQHINVGGNEHSSSKYEELLGIHLFFFIRNLARILVP